MIERMAVVIPARDEAERIGACLASVRRAADLVSIPIDIIVVADGCLDDTTQRASGHAGVTVIETETSNVGASRAVGASHAIARGSQWLANTDADSEVPVAWLAYQLELAAAGTDVVVGTVRPHFAELTTAQQAAWSDSHDAGQAIGHVHGANLGVRTSAYLRAGGYRPLPEHEDTDLVARLVEQGAVLVATGRTEVVTSARPVGRTPGGYARYLRLSLLDLGAGPEPDATSESPSQSQTSAVA